MMNLNFKSVRDCRPPEDVQVFVRIVDTVQNVFVKHTTAVYHDDCWYADGEVYTIDARYTVEAWVDQTEYVWHKYPNHHPKIKGQRCWILDTTNLKPLQDHWNGDTWNDLQEQVFAWAELKQSEVVTPRLLDDPLASKVYPGWVFTKVRESRANYLICSIDDALKEFKAKYRTAPSGILIPAENLMLLRSVENIVHHMVQVKTKTLPIAVEMIWGIPVYVVPKILSGESYKFIV